ncbi:cleft lip and palate transmembrane 1 family protein [Cavenderia fasciculata]|uniref:Cleft lip and palate transmembrane 1 family protein n=1 Tax=Cavenderia fasciculata TaxID=261658 RepID=F4PTS7_CACFS|nr:cleft lip and palate transmembrane 1 family protein [Cavenderia fasciculata]EGG20906.1 cleft lip and palate transmembrane 1 family protein [Cavenderia fasciculata]|eukprot:XP_004358756.1 cleft lip and palate transmembrane 1 family protein [Cavenderia fasciculata]
MQAAAPAAPAAAGGGLIPSWLQSILRFVAFYYIGSMIFGKLLGTSGPAAPTQPVNVTLTNGTTVTRQSTLSNTWSTNTPWNLQIYLSESNNEIGNWLVWEEQGFRYNWEDSNTRETNVSFKCPESLKKNNGTLYAHILANNERDSTWSLKQVHPMVSFFKKPKPAGINLMDKKDENKLKEIEEYDPKELVGHWKPTLTVTFVVDDQKYGPNSLPAEVMAQFNITGDKYSPIVFVNEFWLYREHLTMLNETVEDLNLTMSIYPLGTFKWQMYNQMQKSLDMQQTFGAGEESGDDFKRMLTDTNPYLMGVTVVVTLLHTVFEMLAFKNDIAFWKNNKSMEGLSVRTIILHTICQFIVFLYLLDNETSTMILVSVGFGLLIELWKIGKAMNVTYEVRDGIPRLLIQDKQSYVSKTKQYDDMAMKYLSWVLVPLVIGTSIYSLYYDTHKSWYSWIISSLVKTVYTFEFIMMTPQLFINYKLKSVSRLPFKVFMYRALNTFIDDLFAFIIKMPLMHRLSCLRDDIVFIIYVYQRWIYPVDPNRSQYGTEDGEEEKEKESSSTTTTPAIESSKKDEKIKAKIEEIKEESEESEESEEESEEEEKVEDKKEEKEKSTATKRRTKKI